MEPWPGQSKQEARQRLRKGASWSQSSEILGCEDVNPAECIAQRDSAFAGRSLWRPEWAVKYPDGIERQGKSAASGD
jgi:hypothetical protein